MKMSKTATFFDVDFSKVMGDFKVPMFDVEALVAAQRRNLEAFAAANQLALEGAQAVTRRQGELLRQSVNEVSGMFREMVSNASPEEKLAREAELAKVAFEKTVANVNEIADLVSKAQRDAASVISRRVVEGMEELKGFVSKAVTK
jgi:phasin family protein